MIALSLVPWGRHPALRSLSWDNIRSALFAYVRAAITFGIGRIDLGLALLREWLASPRSASGPTRNIVKGFASLANPFRGVCNVIRPLGGCFPSLLNRGPAAARRWLEVEIELLGGQAVGDRSR